MKMTTWMIWAEAGRGMGRLLQAGRQQTQLGPHASAARVAAVPCRGAALQLPARRHTLATAPSGCSQAAAAGG